MRLLTIVIAFVMSASAEVAPFHWRGSVAQGRAIEVRSINGDVFAEGYEGSQVEVSAALGEGEASTPLHVEAIEHDKGVTICATHENSDGSSGRQCLDDQEPSAQSHAPRVNFTVRVPHGVSLIGRTVNGAVDAQRLESDVEAYTVNGKISISTRGSAQARTVNGSIVASLGNPFWRKGSDFSTVNGSIILNLPEGISTQVQAETINGSISNAFRLRKAAERHDKALRGNIGAGSGSLKVKTINGSIELKKAG